MNRQQRRAAAAQARRIMAVHREMKRLDRFVAPPQRRRVPMIGLVLLLMILFYGAIFLSILSRPSHAHSWYDPACCSGQDCAPAPVGSVVATRNGWAVHIEPGEHPMLGDMSFDDVVPYGSDGIHESQDDQFHVCISGGPDPRLLCLYIPQGAAGV